jgi:hypothetical protein
MTRLFTLITHQLMKRCKEDIGGGLENSQGLWVQEPVEVISKMSHAIALLKRYEKEYKATKKKLAEMPLGMCCRRSLSPTLSFLVVLLD